MRRGKIERSAASFLALGCFVGMALFIPLELRLIAADPTDLSAANDIDHAGIIQSWNAESLARGEKLYNGICITCHGNLTQAGSLPTSRPFFRSRSQISRARLRVLYDEPLAIELWILVSLKHNGVY